MAGMSTREERAARRRATWTGEVVPVGTPKAPHASTSPEERLAALVELNWRAWIATGRSLPAPEPRGSWPGEVFDLVNKRASGRAKDLADIEALEAQ